MKLTQKLLGLGALTAVFFGLYSCTNDLNDTYTQVEGLRLAKTPDITAWSGETFLTPASRAAAFPGSDFITRAEGDGTNEGQGKVAGPPQPWDFESEKHDHTEWGNLLAFKTQSELEALKDKGEAADITEPNFNQNVKIFYVPSGKEANVTINLNSADSEFYNFGTINEWTGNLANPTYLYNAGEIKNFSPSTGQTTLYNTGKININKLDNIPIIYNGNGNDEENVLTLFSEGEKEPVVRSDLYLYSLGDVYLPNGANFQAYADIHGVIYSDDNFTFQNSKDRYVCGLEVEGRLFMCDGTFKTGYIVADELEFDGCHVWLLPDALIKSDVLKLPNSDSEFYCALNSKALVNTEDIEFGNLNDFVATFSDGIYFKVTGKVEVNEVVNENDGQGDKNVTHTFDTVAEYLATENGQAAIPRFNFTLEGNPLCGEDWSSQGSENPDIEDEPCPKADPDDDEDNGCGHSSRKHNDGFCEECEEGELCFDPCPNIKEDVENSGCHHKHSSHHEDENGNIVCDECIEDNADTECNPCPEIKGECEHSGKYHGEDGYCDECDEKGGNCKHPSTSTNPDPDPENPNQPSDPNGPKCPNTGDPDFNDGCDHFHRGKYCPKCSHENGNCKYPEIGESGVTQTEVEVNLSINDEHEKYTSATISDLVAKLSIHVRLDGDVEVFIPIPKNYYVDNDDIVILNTHAKGDFIHGGPTEVEWEVNGKKVTLTLRYEDEGIRVITSGIDGDVYDYCKETYGDGINFEVWLYTNRYSGLTFQSFHDILDQATVEFIDNKYPDYYINAFNDTDENPQGKKDCVVSIINAPEDQFGEAKTDIHLNGSTFNVIYKNKNCTGPEGAHDHDFLWKDMKNTGNSSDNQE